MKVASGLRRRSAIGGPQKEKAYERIHAHFQMEEIYFAGIGRFAFVRYRANHAILANVDDRLLEDWKECGLVALRACSIGASPECFSNSTCEQTPAHL